MSALLEHYGELRAEHQGRDPDLRSTDQAAARAIAQAAVDVEMFTIPLYMTSMFSVFGTHQISGSTDFYHGRWWPGRATAQPTATDDTNTEVFNLAFRVYIEEMLHLQLAANLCSVLGKPPSFTELSPPDQGYAWDCYDKKPEIPHILDFRDTVEPYTNTLVEVGAMNPDQVALFIAIEETQQDAVALIDPDKRDKYFPTVPFDGWQAGHPLPMFGTIGAMYLSLWQYLNITYSDGTNLWTSMYDSSASQRDIFDAVTPSHPEPEYPGFKATIDSADPSAALLEVMTLIDAITDQGEGKGVIEVARRLLDSAVLLDVEPQYQADYQALLADYKGTEDAFARGSEPNVSLDHLEAFQRIQELIRAGNFETWEDWHEAGNQWTAKMLQPDPHDVGPYEDVLPSAQDIADALNTLKHEDHDEHYATISTAATGSIAGVTKVLGDFWETPDTEFPYPSMYGSGDRLSICWAIFGVPPDLTKPVPPRPQQLNHSCQGLDLDQSTRDPATCAEVALYHTCKGSNDCAAEGGCGFVHSASGGGGNCSHLAKVSFSSGCGVCGGGKGGAPYSAPSDNKCGGLGGCAVPISASQLYPAPAQGPATMDVYDNGPGGPTLLGTIEYAEGQPVYDVAWEAYIKVLEHRQVEPLPPKPSPASLFRLAFPPST